MFAGMGVGIPVIRYFRCAVLPLAEAVVFAWREPVDHLTLEGGGGYASRLDVVGSSMTQVVCA